MFRTAVCLTLCLMSSEAFAQNFGSPKTIPPSDETVFSLKEKHGKLARYMASLRRQGVRDPGLADVEIYERAVRMLFELGEYYHKDTAAWADEVLDRGLLRAKLLGQGDTPWAVAVGHPVIRAYRSRVDGSVQPFAVSFPADFGKTSKTYRVDFVMHGRDPSLTEVKFLHTYNGDRKYSETDRVEVQIFGRGNVAYRWAGETDVFEVMQAFWSQERSSGRDRFLDGSKTVLRGFSMGGAGTWHLGLHHPDRWALLSPGAGFSTTHGYVSKLPKPLASPQEECLAIYDAINYAENAFNVPIVAYSGAKDPQKLAADLVEERLKKLRIPMKHLIAPDLEHAFPAEWQKKANVLWKEELAKERPAYPPEIRFVTYTLKYPSSKWVEILSLEQHYKESRVHAKRTEEGFEAKTANVRQLHLTLPSGDGDPQKLDIDGQSLKLRPWMDASGIGHLYLTKKDGRWKQVLPQRLANDRGRQPQKIVGLTGPIDDAFCDGFVCLRGSGKAWHAATDDYVKADLERFAKEWSKHLRGDLPVKDEEELTGDEVLSKHLILFGDPGSNSMLAEILDALPITWTKDEIRVAGKTYDASKHVPALIFPNPLNPAKYVVINSGHTFHAAEFQKTNALIYPRLGDWAVLRLVGGDALNVEPAASGLFDEFWKVK
ncbi:MAG: alpha/beta hydrolase [Gemmataceae bacterium]|nr:alpha/beta hydrolase [Gemmataceae bacterium]